MVYKDFQDLKLSALGMGCMRLPVVGGNDAVVDEAAAEEMVDCAMANGVLLRHRLGYHNGNSEIALGKAWPNIPGKNFTLPTSSPVTTYPTCPRCRRFLRSS
ncbi:MAG: hypothetical protein ACLTYN_01350 [Dysosmobacter welbionis]